GKQRGCEEGSEVRAARFIGRGLVTSETRTAGVIEKFAEYIQVIIPPPRLEPVQPRNSPNISLKRASSRTKSSNRRLAAVSSRKANQARSRIAPITAERGARDRRYG